MENEKLNKGDMVLRRHGTSKMVRTVSKNNQ